MQTVNQQQIQELHDNVALAKFDAKHGHYAIELDMPAHSSLLRIARYTGMLDRFLTERYAVGTLLLDEAEYHYLKDHLHFAHNALDRYATIPNRAERPIFKYFGHGTSAGLISAYPKLAQLMQDTHMLALAREPGSKDNHLYTTLVYRSTALEAIGLLRPDIAAEVQQEIQDRGIDPNDIGELPMTTAQIDSFFKSYKDVISMLDKGKEPGALAAQKMATISKHSIIRRRPPQTMQPNKSPEAPRSLLVERGDDGHTKISRQPSEESINNFLLPLEVLEPVRDTLKRLEHAQMKSDGLHEKMRRNPVEAWIGYTDRSMMVAQGRQLEHLLEMHPHLKEKIHCVTVYPARDGRKPHMETQALMYAHEEPPLSDSTQERIVRHRPEFWLAVPENLLGALQGEATRMRAQTQDAKDMFVQALSEPDPIKSKEMRNEADGYLQLILNEYKARNILSDNFTTRALRSNPETQDRPR